jgi:hypothetical protein
MVPRTDAPGWVWAGVGLFDLVVLVLFLLGITWQG